MNSKGGPPLATRAGALALALAACGGAGAARAPVPAGVKEVTVAAAAVVAAPPAPWRAADVGAVVTARGQSICVPSACRFQFGGGDIGGRADSFYFVHQPVRGDGELVVRVHEVDALPAAKVGLMVRAGLAADAPYAFVGLLGDEESTLARLQVRRAAGADSESRAVDLRARRVWLRIARRGDEVIASRGPDGSPGPPWRTLATYTLPLPREALFGLAMEAHGDHEPAVADVLEATLRGFGVDDAAAERWSHFDVRAIGGTVHVDGDVVTLSGWGDPPVPDREPATLLFRRARPDERVEVVARVLSQQDAAAEARAGVSIRDSGSSGGSARSAANAGAWLYAGTRGVVLEYRPASGKRATLATLDDLRPPVWLRLRRTTLGAITQFSGAASRDGERWSRVGTIMLAPFEVKDSLTAGLFVTSGHPSAMHTARFDHVDVAVSR